ncbi:hypothetical protein CLV76_12944 [Marivita geojedonensis]|nr:hypothetical protein CLV76_12944 [Marivita geojedonensis]
MCKNEGNPCPGCEKHKSSDAAWMFFTEEERLALDAISQTKAPVRAVAAS